MGAIEDTRKVSQDFLAPELRAIAARLDAVEKRQEKLADDMERRFDHAEKQAERRHDALQVSIQSMVNYHELRERMARLESARESVAQ
jgi:predicted phage gp36 major capsid-like protein